MMNPEPRDVTCLGTFCGPRKSLNKSCNGELGGRSRLTRGPDFNVWVVAILTTVGRSLFARSANDSGAGRAKAADGASVAAGKANVTATMARTKPMTKLNRRKCIGRASVPREDLSFDSEYSKNEAAQGRFTFGWRRSFQDPMLSQPSARSTR